MPAYPQHFVVVCPSSLVGGWAKEFDKWVGKASQPKRVVIQKGDADSISRLKSVYSSTRQMHGQVLIISFELFRRIADNFTASIGLLVMDEAHRIKSREGMTFAALDSLACEAKLCITAVRFSLPARSLQEPPCLTVHLTIDPCPEQFEGILHVGKLCEARGTGGTV